MTDDPVALLREAVDKATLTPHPTLLDYGCTPDGQIWSLSSNWRGYGVRPLIPVVDKYGYFKGPNHGRWASADAAGASSNR